MSASAQQARMWPLAVRLAWRDLRGGIGGLKVFMACLLLGVAAIAAVGSVSQAMLDGLRQDGRRLLGGDVDLRLIHREAGAEEQAWLSEQGEVTVISEMRAMARADSGKRRLVELRGVEENYPLYGQVELRDGLPLQPALARNEGYWGAAVDSRVLDQLGIEVGATLRLGALDYRVEAVIEREPDRATRSFTLGPSVVVARASLAETELIQPGSLVHHHYRIKLPPGSDVVAFRNRLNERYPEVGWRIRDLREASPGVRRFIERVGLFLSLIGLTSLLVGGVGVSNAVSSHLQSKTESIATLKCLGASNRLIFSAYLVQILGLAGLASALGCAIGALAPAAVGLLLADQLGWQAAEGIRWLPLALAAAFGLLTALTFSLLPLSRASRLPAAHLFRSLIAPSGGGFDWKVGFGLCLAGGCLVALALLGASDRWVAAYFVAGAALALLLFRLAAWGFMAVARRLRVSRDAGLRLAVANLHRPGAATVSVVLSLGLGISVLVGIAQIEGNLRDQVEGTLPEDAPSLYFIDIQGDQVADFDRLVESQTGVAAVERVPMLRGRITAVGGISPEAMEIPSEIAWVFRGDRGLTWRREAIPDSELAAGEWWPTDYDGPPLVSLDAEVGRALGIGPGDSLTVNILGRDVVVEIANLRIIDWSTLGINFVLVFSPGLLETVPQSHIATVRATPAAEEALELEVTEKFANVSAIRVKDALESAAEVIGHLAVAVRATAAFAVLVGVLVLAGAVAAGHRRRVYDSVVLKVLGATKKEISLAFMYEYGILGLVTAAIAAVVGSLAAYIIMTEVMHLPFHLLPVTVAGIALLTAVLTISLGYLGTWRALAQKAAPLLRNE